MRDGALVFGTQYYRPPFPTRDAWSSDLDLIVNSGMNTVKIWAVWSWIERSNGAYYFDDLDELVELCSSKRLQTVINIVPEGAPYWLERLHPDARYQAENGMALEFSGAATLPSGGGLRVGTGQISEGACPFHYTFLFGSIWSASLP